MKTTLALLALVLTLCAPLRAADSGLTVPSQSPLVSENKRLADENAELRAKLAAVTKDRDMAVDAIKAATKTLEERKSANDKVSAEFTDTLNAIVSRK